MLIKNKSIETVSLGNDEGIVLFDSETGNTHVLDYAGADILACFDTESGISAAVDKLAEMYNTDKAEIEADVIEYVNKLLAQGVLVRKEAV